MQGLTIFLLIFAVSFTQSSKKKQKSNKSKLTSIRKSTSKKVKRVRQQKKTQKNNANRNSTTKPNRNSNRNNSRNNRSNRNNNRNNHQYSIYPVPFYLNPYNINSSQIIYVENEKSEEITYKTNEEYSQYYDDYPFHSNSLIKKEGKPYIFKSNFTYMPINEDQIQNKEFMMQIDYKYFHISYDYSFMYDNVESFIFQNITPGITIGIPKHNIMLTFKAGAGLMTIEKDRTYGGLTAGFTAFTIVEPNLSARFSIDYNSYKDKSNDDETLFNTLKTDFSLGMHFSRLELRGGFRIKQFMLLDEPFSIRQPYIGLGIWF